MSQHAPHLICKPEKWERVFLGGFFADEKNEAELDHIRNETVFIYLLKPIPFY